jgi:hypothetical protein
VVILLHDPGNASRVYLGTDTRATGLLLGAALSCALPIGAVVGQRAARALDLTALASLAGLAVAWVAMGGQAPFLYRGGLWLTELAGVALIAGAVGAPGGLTARLLEIAPLRGLGTISYGVYLWHWPVDCVITLERTHLGPAPLTLLRGAVTLAIALASYRFLERPIRTRGLPAGGAYAVPVLIAVLVFGIWFATARPPRSVGPDLARAFPSTSSEGTLRVLVVGDSVAEHFGRALRRFEDGTGAIVAERGVGQCSLVPEPLVIGGVKVASRDCSSTWRMDAAELHPDATLVFLGGGFLAERCEPAWRERNQDRLVDRLQSMKEDAGRVVVVLVPDPGGRWRQPGSTELVTCFDGDLAAAAAKVGADTLDLRAHICPTPGTCDVFAGGEPIRPDGLHFDFAGKGAEETARWTLKEVERIYDTRRY